MKNPFPGMNPWLEEHWRDVHARFLVHASEQLNEELPGDLRARIDERLLIDFEDEKPRSYRPDVAITEAWDNPPGPPRGPGGVAVTAAEPIVVDLSDVMLRRLEIVDSREHIITVLELLSPSNKDETEHRDAWEMKRSHYLRGGMHLMEIDLLRGGGWTLPDRSRLPAVPPGRVYHYVCVTRVPLLNRHEFYVLPLRERLPAIRVPLRQGESDVALDLQRLINQCYERGRYGAVIRYANEPIPPLPPEEAAWAREILPAVN